MEAVFSSSKFSKSKGSDPVANVELDAIGSKRSKKVRNLPTWVEDNGRDSNVIMTNSLKSGEVDRRHKGDGRARMILRVPVLLQSVMLRLVR